MKILRAIYFLLSFFLLVEATFNEETIKTCHYIKHEIQIVADSSDQFILKQQGREYEFESERSFGSEPKTFTLNVPDLPLKTGPATIYRIVDSIEEPYEINLTDYSFEPEIDEVKEYDTIKIIPTQCSNASNYIRIFRENEEGELNLVKMPETNDNCGYSFSTVSPGVYYIKAENPYTQEYVTVTTFTHIGDQTIINKDKLHFDFPMPTSPDGSTPITITYPASLGKINNIRVKKNEDFIYLELKEDSGEDHYFTINKVGDINYVAKVYIKYGKPDNVYQISMIIFSNYQAIKFNNNEVQVGYSFSINDQYFLHKNELEVTLQFESSQMAAKHKNSIIYKQLDSSSSSMFNSFCTENGSSLKCKIISEGTSSIGIGIGNCLLSSQIITVFSYKVETTDITENNCIVEKSQESLSNLRVSIDFPKERLPKQFATYLLKDYLYNAEKCDDSLNENTYDINCDLSYLSAGHYYFTIIFDGNENLPKTIKDINFEIKSDYMILNVEPKSLYRISPSKELVITFDKEVKKGEITKIKLVRGIIESQEYSVIEDSDSKIKKFNINNLDQQQRPLPFGTLNIYYNSPCQGSSSFISSSTHIITLDENKISSIKPEYLVISDPTSSVKITFLHQAGHMLDQLLFINNNDSKKNVTTINITQPSSDYITVPSSAFSQQGHYTIKMKYSDTSKDKTGTLYVFNDKIQLEKETDYVTFPSNVTYIRIPLKESIISAQILKITMIKEGFSEETEFSLVEDKLINVTIPDNTFNKLGSYEFYIYDKLTTEPLKYTIQCVSQVNLAVAIIDVNITNPAANGTNFIYLTFHNYKVSNIETIVFSRIDRVNEEATPIKFCKKGVSGCDYEFEIISSSGPNLEDIRVTITYEQDEIYLYKYVLYSISDNMLTRYFEDEQHVLLDFSMSHNIFGFIEGESISFVDTIFELYSEDAANQISNSISCKLSNADNDSKEECNESNNTTCKINCSTKCVKSGTTMVCSFKLTRPISEESTILYKFGEHDLNYKYLHLMKVIPTAEICKLANFDENLNMQICSYNQPNNIALFFNEEITSECKISCYGYDIHWNEYDKCTDISIPYEYALGPLKVQAIRNKNEINHFTVETNFQRLNLLQEIMQDYQGKLIAQMEGDQNVKYIFPSGSNASKIKQITLTHQTEDITFIVDAETCIADSNKLECFYDLKDKIEKKYLGWYDISYIHSECGEEFRFANAIIIEEPPVILVDVTPNYLWLGDSDKFELTYLYYFYENSCNIPSSITLVHMIDETERRTIEKEKFTYSGKNLYFTSSQINIGKTGYYYIIEHFGNCFEDKIHKDKQIMFYLHEIEISPSNVTYHTDEPKPDSTTTFFVRFPILKEQISSVTLGGKLVENVFTPNNITFIFTPGLIDFTKGGEHKIIIETITRRKVTFTVFVKYVKTLSESEIVIEGPVPGYENTTNIIHFFSPGYNLTKLSHIVFSKIDSNGIESTYDVNKETIIENYCVDNNTINLPIYLKHGTSYTYKGVYNKQLNEANEKGKGSYTLKGFFIEQHFYFLNKNDSIVYYHINFYTNKIAHDTIGRIRENNVINGHCGIKPTGNHIVECHHDFTLQNKKPITLNISIDKDATSDKVLPVHIMSAEIDQTCFANKFNEKGITLNIKSADSVGTVKGYFNDQIVNSVGIKKTDHYFSIINFEFPIFYEPTVLNMFVEFERNETISRLEVPDSAITFINYAEVSDIPTKYINPLDNGEKLLKIKLTHEVSDSDLSHVVLENKNNKNDKIKFDNCSIKSDVHENDVYTCDVSQIEEYIIYLVRVYDSCGKELNPIGKFYVYFTNKFNFLQQLSPKAVSYSDLSDTLFTLTYNSSLQSLPEKIELVNYNGDTLSNYQVKFAKHNLDGNSRYLRATISGSKQIGLFRVKSTFNPTTYALNEDYSALTILIYENEIAFSKTSETYPYGTTMKSIKLSLSNPIISEQISKVTYQQHNNDPRDGIEANWELTSSRQITVFFQGELKLEDNYVISIIPVKEEADDVTFTLNVFVSYNFEFSREYIDMGNADSFTMAITPIDDFEHNIVKVESNDKEVTVYKRGGSSNIWYEVTYTKASSFTLPKEIKFKYYFQNVTEPYEISKSIYITDYYHSFFDYGPYIGKTYYRESKFEIILTSTRNIDYSGLNAYLTNGYNEKELLHDRSNPKRFYLNSLVGINAGEMELIIFEKGDREAIVDQGQKFTFSEKSSPEIGNSGCFNNGKLIGKYCKCPNGYYGKTCSYTEDNVDDVAKDFIENLEKQEEGFDIKNPVIIQDLLDLVAIAQAKTMIIPNMNKQVENFKTIRPSSEEEVQGYFAFASILIEGDKNGSARRLSEQQRYNILKRTKQVATEWKLNNSKPFSTFELPLQNIYYHKIRATSDAFEQYKQSNTELKPSFIEIPNIDDSNGFYLLSANEEHGEYNLNKKQSKVSIEFEYYPSDSYRRMLSENSNDELLVHFSLQDFSIPEDDIASYYGKKGINLFNTNEPFFTDKCYSVDPDKFDFDLTHKYRMKLYPNASFELNDDYNCKYKGMGVIPEYMTYTCSSPKLSNKVTVNMELKEKELSKEKTESSIPLKCVGQITKVYNNIGFWLFFLLILLMINAILFILFMKHVITKETTSTNPPDAVSQGALQQKQNCIVVTDDNRSTQGKNVFKKVSNTITVNDKSPRGEADKLPTLAQGQIQLQVQDGYSPYDDEETPSSFVQWLLYNLKRYHPIPANYFCKERYLQIPIFVFSITTMFAFNAILFKESYIDARVNNESRNSFGYPLAHEAGAVFGAIFIAWIFSAIPKTIYYFLMEKELSELIKKILSISFIAVITVLMFIWWIYSIGFCGVYKNTQFGWFYACIWSLFFDWILFAPVFVVAVSFVNYKFPALKPELIKMIKEIARF